jgi:hypothetical protein
MIIAGMWDLAPFAGRVRTDLLLRGSGRPPPTLAAERRAIISAAGFNSKGPATFYNSDTGN